MIGNRTIFYGNWVEKGVYAIGGLVDWQRFKLSAIIPGQIYIYVIATNFLTYNGCVQAVKNMQTELDWNVLVVFSLVKIN